MSNRLRSFDFLCRCLGADISSRATAALRHDVDGARLDWRLIIGAAAEHFVLPLLWRRLTDRGLDAALPPLVAELLRDLHDRNVERNLRLRAQTLEIGAALDEIGIEALILKGANALFDGPAHLAERMMADLDLLVPRARLADSVARLERIGYRAADPAADAGGFFHHPPLFRQGTLATVELHVDIGEQRHVLSPADAVARGRTIAPGLAMPATTHRIVHNVFHAAAQNRDHALALASLKDLCEFVTLAESTPIDAAPADWVEVRRRFAGQTRLLDTHAGLAARLLGWTPPAALGAVRIGVLHYRRSRLQLRWPALRRLAEICAAATYPLRRTRIEYRFGPSPNRLVHALHRARHLRDLLRRHRHGLFARIALARDNYREQRRSLRW